MSVHNNLDVIRQVVRRYVLQAKLQSAPHNIDNQWPFQIAVAISPDDGDSRPNRAKLLENGLRANIAQMPDFIGIPGDFFHVFRQTIVGVRKYEHTQHLIRFLLVHHILSVSLGPLICAMVDVT